jgi:hypothetical protein
LNVVAIPAPVSLDVSEADVQRPDYQPSGIRTSALLCSSGPGEWEGALVNNATCSGGTTLGPSPLHLNSSALDERHQNSEMLIVLPGHPIARVELRP